MSNEKRRGILWMLTASLFFSFMALSVKLTANHASVSQTVFFRALVGLLILVARSRQKQISLWGHNRRLLLFRGLMGTLSLYLYFYGISLLPIGTASILNATAPIFVVLLSGWLIQEKAPKGAAWLLLPMMAGAAFILKPVLSTLWIPSVLCILSGLFGAFAYLSVRRLGKQESATTIIFYFSLLALIGSAIPTWVTWHPIDARTTTLLLASGLFATVAQYAMTEAYRHGKAGLVSLFSYASPVFAYLLGLLVLGDRPNVWSSIGGLLILGAGLSASRLR